MNKKLFFFVFTLLIMSPSAYAEEVDLRQPVYNHKQITEWSEKALKDTLDFDFSNYNKRLEESSSYFTFYGSQSFREALKSSGTLEYISKYKIVLSTEVTAIPQIINEGIGPSLTDKRAYDSFLLNILMHLDYISAPQSSEGPSVYFWEVQAPIQVVYESGTKIRKDNMLVTLKIERSNNQNNPDKIGISQYLAAAK